MHIASKKKMLNGSASVAPEVCTTLMGEQIGSVEGIHGTTHFVRLLTFLPGKLFALVKPHDVNLLTSLGRFFGNIGRVLQDFEHPAAHRDFHWDLKNASRIIESYMNYIRDPENRDLIKRFLERFQAKPSPNRPQRIDEKIPPHR